MAPPCYKDWTGPLVEALERIREVERHYIEELYEQRLQRELGDARVPSIFQGTVSDPARDRRSFYWHACRAEGIYNEQRYSPLRDILECTVDIVGQHPALTPALTASRCVHEFTVYFLNNGHGTSFLAVVAGLMCRAEQVGKDGFRIASDELKSLLDLSLEEDVGSDSNELTVGYHVLLFYGLRFSEDLQIADGLMAVPLERTEPFLNRGVLDWVAPSIVREKRWEAVGAMIRHVPWKPVILPRGDKSEPQLDWEDSFFEDAPAFIEILSVSHGVPVVTLMDIPYCIHRTALLLLGAPHYHSGSGHKLSWTRSSEDLRGSNQLDVDALDQARHVFSDLNHQRHQKLAPVISRLSEALARSGQYALDDKILDLAIALEQMYELDQGEISFKLKTRAACFLESDTKARLRVFKDVKLLYEARSGIVHGRTGKPKREAFERGFDVARNSVIKLLREGRPADWNKVILAPPGHVQDQSID